MYSTLALFPADASDHNARHLIFASIAWDSLDEMKLFCAFALKARPLKMLLAEVPTQQVCRLQLLQQIHFASQRCK